MSEGTRDPQKTPVQPLPPLTTEPAPVPPVVRTHTVPAKRTGGGPIREEIPELNPKTNIYQFP